MEKAEEGEKVSKTEKLAQLYKQANALNEDLPKELMDKLSVYGKILELIGGLWADAECEYGLAKNEREYAIDNAIYYRPSIEDGEVPSSDKRAEAVGGLLAKELKDKEKELSSEVLRWKNAFYSVDSQIQILKKKYDHLKEVSKGGI
jgi:hypothetical protein